MINGNPFLIIILHQPFNISIVKTKNNAIYNMQHIMVKVGNDQKIFCFNYRSPYCNMQLKTPLISVLSSGIVVVTTEPLHEKTNNLHKR